MYVCVPVCVRACERERERGERERVRETDRHTDRHTDRQTDRQTLLCFVKYPSLRNKQTDGRAGGRTDGHTDIFMLCKVPFAQKQTNLSLIHI